MKKNEQDAASKKKPKTSAAQIRVQKGAPVSYQTSSQSSFCPPPDATDLTELDLPSTMQTKFPDPADLLNFTLTISPDEGESCAVCLALCRTRLTAHIRVGMYKGGEFTFSFAINTNYPHDPPKVKCIPKVSFLSITRPACDFNTDRPHSMLDLPP